MEREKALNQIRAMYKFMAEPEKDVLLTLIPELKESEEERIMKQIHLCLNECVYHDIIRDYEEDEILAWLEKQKAPLHTLETHKETPNSFTDDRIKNAIWQVLSKGESTKILNTMGVKLSEAFEYLENQQEQKPIEKISVSEELYEHIRNACACLEDANCSKEELSSKWKKERYDQARYDLEEAMKIISSEQPKEFTHHETNESLIDAVTHQMEDDENVDDFVRRGIDDIALKYAELGAKWQKEQKELPLMDGNADLYFDEWNQQKQNPTKRQCFEEGIRYANRFAEWSEEDEDIEKAIESVIRVYGKTQGEFIAGYDMDTLIFHLRAVFHRNNSWNDKDKNAIVDILRGLHKGILYKEAEEIADDILKSLRPQPHWKPSEK